MADLAIITALYGSYDNLQQPLLQEGLDVDWIVVTDSLAMKMEYEMIGGSYGDQRWRVVYDPRPGEKPFRAAKRAKFQPWLYTDAPASIWLDGTVRVIEKGFALKALKLTDHQEMPIAAAPHTERDCLYPEAEVSTYIKKYVGEPILQQTDHYRAQGHPEHWGLWFTTVLVRRHTEQVRAACEAWEQECSRWSSQDQVSFPYVVRNHGLQVACMHAMPYAWGILQFMSNNHNAANLCDATYAYSHHHNPDCRCEVCIRIERDAT